MTSTFEHDLDRVKLNQQAKYLGQMPFRSKVIVQTHRLAQRTDRSTWTTKVVDNYCHIE